jgi:hypothetical protein
MFNDLGWEVVVCFVDIAGIATTRYTPHKQSLGVYGNHPVRPSVRRPSMYLVSATPPKPLIGFL